MSDLKERVLKEEIKMFFISEKKLAIYGKTYEVRNELKNIGATWNRNRKRLEIEIIEKTFELRNKQREESIEKISHLIMSKEIVVVKDKNDNYIITSDVKETKQKLYYAGFKLVNESFTMNSEDFEKIFPNEVKEEVNQYNINQEPNEEKKYEENIEEEVEY